MPQWEYSILGVGVGGFDIKGTGLINASLLDKKDPKAGKEALAIPPVSLSGRQAYQSFQITARKTEELYKISAHLSELLRNPALCDKP